MGKKENKQNRIFIDHQIFSFQNFGGISRVFTELCREYDEKKIEYKLPILLSNNENIVEVKKVKSFFPKSKSFLLKTFIYLINRIYNTILLIIGNYDIFQPTYYDPYFIPFLGKKPFVLLVHDMTHEIYPEIISKNDKTVKWKRYLIEKADRILAISESTKKDIIKFYNISPSKIEIVSWGTSMSIPEGNFDLDIPNKYILFIGNRKGIYKNFEKFFISISPLLKEDKELYLLCNGGGEFNEKEISLFSEYGVEDKVRFFGWNGPDEMAYIYSKALCFVFPSLYEGFGIPVLEAFACDCPAVLSNTSSLPEVGGDAAIYFDPNDKDSIKDSVKKVVYDEKLRKEMIKKGRERLKLFSWEKAADKFIKLYKSI